MYKVHKISPLNIDSSHIQQINPTL